MRKSLGEYGSQITTGTGAWTGDAYAVQFVTDCTPTTFTVGNGTGTYTGVRYPKGMTFIGDITALTVGSGETFIVYLRTA